MKDRQLMLTIIEEIEKYGNRLYMRSTRGYGASHPYIENSRPTYGKVDDDLDNEKEEIKPVNAGVANLYGLELEARKLIAFQKDEARNLFFGSNITFVKSQIDMEKVLVEKGDELVSERELREANARDGETIGRYRSMFGQSPYIVNAYLNYDDTLGLDVNLSYNVQGDRLSVVGVGRVPDVYEKAFHSLNLKVSKTFGSKDQWKFSVSGRNLLNNANQKVYKSFNAEEQIYGYRNQGITISSSITLKL